MARSILPGLALSAAVVATALALYVLVAGGPGPRAPGDLPDSAENGQVRLPGEPAVAAPRERTRREPAAEGAVPVLAAPVPVVAFPGGPFVPAPGGGGPGAAPVTLSSSPARGRAHHPPGGIDPGRGACGVAVGRADRGDATARRGRTAGSGRAGGAGPAGALPAARAPSRRRARASPTSRPAAVRRRGRSGRRPWMTTPTASDRGDATGTTTTTGRAPVSLKPSIAPDSRRAVLAPPEGVAVTDAGAELGAEAEPEVGAEPLESGAGAEPGAEPEPAAGAEPEPGAGAEPEPGAAPEPQAEPEPGPGAEPEQEPDPGAQPEPHPAPEPVPGAEPEPGAGAEPEPEPEPPAPAPEPPPAPAPEPPPGPAPEPPPAPAPPPPPDTPAAPEPSTAAPGDDAPPDAGP